MRRCPHSCSGSATTEHMIPVKITAATAATVSVPTPCTAVGGSDSTATVAICIAVNGSVGSTFA